jgi:hypothetical protein
MTRCVRFAIKFAEPTHVSQRALSAHDSSCRLSRLANSRAQHHVGPQFSVSLCRIFVPSSTSRARRVGTHCARSRTAASSRQVAQPIHSFRQGWRRRQLSLYPSPPPVPHVVIESRLRSGLSLSPRPRSQAVHALPRRCSPLPALRSSCRPVASYNFRQRCSGSSIPASLPRNGYPLHPRGSGS